MTSIDKKLLYLRHTGNVAAAGLAVGRKDDLFPAGFKTWI
jgi:uncharacterized protein (DUF2062 family)